MEQNNESAPASERKKRGVLVVARHAERLDYVLRDAGSNFVTLPTTDRPWDPPLTHHGRRQARRLGGRVAELLADHGLPLVSAVYSSPFLRCCQTATEAVVGMREAPGNGAGNDHGGGDENLGEACDHSDSKIDPRNNGTNLECKVKVEQGLSESLCEKWYRSWCLQGSNGTWGWPEGGNDVASFDGRKHAKQSKASKLERRESSCDVDEKTVHPSAMVPVHQLLATSDEIVGFLRREDKLRPAPKQPGDDLIDETELDIKRCNKLEELIDLNHKKSLDPIGTPYQWSNFEGRKLLDARMASLVEHIIQQHPDETVLLVSHGGPVTWLFEQLTGRPWTDHGHATYACVSLYSHDGNRDDGKKLECVVVNDRSCSD